MFGGQSFSREPQRRKIGTHLPESEALSMEGQGAILREGEITACQPLPRGSNYVYLTTLKWNGTDLRAIYKPRRGETPLYDFPDGTLYQRERAAYLVSQALEWCLIPPTIIREGPHGIGMLQWFVAAQTPDYDRFFDKHLDDFKRVAVFDWLVNNADRKGGHCLEGLDGRLWFIDHGLTFNVAPKLRTIIWDFSGQPVPSELLADLETLLPELEDNGALTEALDELLAPEEIEALRGRLAYILKRPVYPDSFGSYRRTPWPPY